MADNRLLKNHYIETDYRGSKDKCIESPLLIARPLVAIKLETEN